MALSNETGIRGPGQGSLKSDSLWTKQVRGKNQKQNLKDGTLVFAISKNISITIQQRPSLPMITMPISQCKSTGPPALLTTVHPRPSKLLGLANQDRHYQGAGHKQRPRADPATGADIAHIGNHWAKQAAAKMKP